MPNVIGVRFRTSPRMYYFAPIEGERYEKDSKVVVETQRGVEIATVILPVTEVSEDKIVAPLKTILRAATEDDLAAVAMDDERRQSIISTAKQKVAERGLDMKVVDCEYTVDRSKLVLYFTAEQRVDFRELVRDLASAFHSRIDLRQIGARDECKLIGSLGSCGLPCCCGRFESDNEHVSIKMAKYQNLALTPNKINGMCGRLLCCLSYENKTYEEVAKRSPKIGAWVTTPDGKRGTVASITPLTETVRVRVGDDDSFEFCDYPLDEIAADKSAPDRQKSPKRENDDRPQQKPQKQKPFDKSPTGDDPARQRSDNDGNRHGKKFRRGNGNNGNGNNGANNGNSAPVADAENRNNKKRNKNKGKRPFGGNGNNGGKGNNGGSGSAPKSAAPSGE